MALQPYDAVLDDTTMDGIDVQQIIDGITGSRNVAHTMVADHATSPPLTLKSTHASGPALLIKNPADANRWRFGRETAGDDASAIDVFRLLDGARMIYADGDGAMHAANRFTMFDTDASNNAVMVQWVYENNSIGATPDVATTAILGIQRTGDAYFRTVEIDQIAVTGTSTWPKLGIELSIEANHLGNNVDRTVGISVINFGTGWGLATPKIVDTAFMAKGSQHGFVNYFLAIDTDANAAATLFRVNQLGIVESKGFLPLADSTYDAGSAAFAFNKTYSDRVVITATGSTSNTSIQPNGDANTGITFSAADSIELVTSGANRVQVTSTGNVALGGGLIATNATAGFVHIACCAGVPTGVPTAVSGYIPVVIDSTNDKMYLYNFDAGAWVALN